ncbi:MAG: sugar phosphate isomerase/epimerase family protein, partial [Thermoflexales bacterium]
SGLSDAQALEQAVSLFRRLGDIAQAHGVVICLEPNPVAYGANFMTNSQETAAVVTAVSHTAIRMQLDTGAMTLNGEKPEEVLEAYGHLVGHVHISEPYLAPIGDGATDHRAARDALRRYLPEHVVSIEMAATKHEPHTASIRRALAKAVAWYCAS